LCHGGEDVVGIIGSIVYSLESTTIGRQLSPS
jgi:hypothetical protein